MAGEKNRKPGKPRRLTKPFRASYRINQIRKLRDSLYAILCHEFVEPQVVPAGPLFDRLIQLVWECLPGELDQNVLEDSLRHLAGKHPQAATYLETCWRLAGNLPRLALRRP